MLDFDAAADGHEFTLGLGQRFTIRLDENGTTGYRWYIAADGGPACVPTDDASEPDMASAPADAVPGRPGSRVWRFQAVQVGAGYIELVERRLWEADAAPAHRFTLRPRVIP